MTVSGLEPSTFRLVVQYLNPLSAISIVVTVLSVYVWCSLFSKTDERHFVGDQESKL